MKTGSCCNKRNIWSGIIAGLIAGVAFGFILIRMHMMAEVASLFGMANPLAGYILHLIWSAILGIIFALIFNSVAKKFFPIVIWGVVYGIVWWFLGSLTLMPLMMGMSVSWGSAALAQGIPMLVGYLVFGLVLGFSYYWVRNRK